MLRFRSALRFIGLLCLCALPALTQRGGAQSAAPIALTGAVLDPSGAFIPHATLRFRGAAGTRSVTADDGGQYALSIAPGAYSLTVTATGFRSYARPSLVISPSRNAPLNITLEISTDTEEVNVSGDSASSTDAASNKGALVFKDDQLDTFSDDPALMQQQLLALGGSDPTNPPQIYVDGFSNGTLPPKESIREIRINQNPFSAVYDQFGQGRIEIFTKPGANKLHGGVDFLYGNSALNTGDPYVAAQPPYNQDFIFANANGPLGKKSSYYFNLQRRRQNANAVVDAVTDIDATGNNVTFTQALPNPILNQTFTTRFDHQFGPKDTFIARYAFADASASNSGVGQLVLASQGSSTTTHTQTVQLSDSHIFSPRVIFDSALQYIHTSLRQTPNSTAPGVNVQGAFNGGGGSAQALDDKQDRLELQEYFSIAHDTHFIRTGLRYRLLHDANTSTAGYNGAFDFTSITAYAITQQGLAQHETDAQIRATCVTASNGAKVCGGASQYSITTGQSTASVVTGDLGLFAEDEWKRTPNLTLNYGLRVETQTAVPTHFDFGPRVGFAYSIKRNAKAKDPLLVVRGGFGLFYTRFPSGNILQALRQNGVSQQTYIIENPTFSVSNIPPVSSLSALQPTVYTINPHLRSPMQMQGLMVAERTLGKYGNITAQYFVRRSTHGYESLNVNAPLPGTYNPANPASGVRPFGGTQNIYEFSSDGISTGHNFTLNANINFTPKINLFLFSTFGSQHSDTNFGGGFVSNSYNVRQDYGHITGFAPRQLFTGINAQLPHDVRLNVFVAARATTPFNITVGQDLNGDTQYNDRPAFATDLTRPSVVHTAYGTFDTAPVAGQTIIPYNYGNGPATLYTEINLGKTFHFGPRDEPTTPAGAPGAPTSAPGVKGTPAKPAPLPPQRYSFVIATEIDNPLNVVNAGTPVGVLSSPLFGKSISLSNNFTLSNSANRVILIHGAFHF